MKTRQLGRSGLEVSALGLGCMGTIATKFGWAPDTPGDLIAPGFRSIAVASKINEHDPRASAFGRSSEPFARFQASSWADRSLEKIQKTLHPRYLSSRVWE